VARLLLVLQGYVCLIIELYLAVVLTWDTRVLDEPPRRHRSAARDSRDTCARDTRPARVLGPLE